MLFDIIDTFRCIIEAKSSKRVLINPEIDGFCREERCCWQKRSPFLLDATYFSYKV